jgi:hypothetical protein
MCDRRLAPERREPGAVGLAESDLDLSRRRLTAAAQAELLEYAALALNDPLFGLRLAEQSNPREVGLLFYATSAAEDVAEALSLVRIDLKHPRIAVGVKRKKIGRAEQDGSRPSIYPRTPAAPA